MSRYKILSLNELEVVLQGGGYSTTFYSKVLFGVEHGLIVVAYDQFTGRIKLKITEFGKKYCKGTDMKN